MSERCLKYRLGTAVKENFCTCSKAITGGITAQLHSVVSSRYLNFTSGKGGQFPSIKQESSLVTRTESFTLIAKLSDELWQ